MMWRGPKGEPSGLMTARRGGASTRFRCCPGHPGPGHRACRHPGHPGPGHRACRHPGHPGPGHRHAATLATLALVTGHAATLATLALVTGHGGFALPRHVHVWISLLSHVVVPSRDGFGQRPASSPYADRVPLIGRPRIWRAACAASTGMAGEIRIGCSGWQYRHWRGRYYPRDLSTDLWLEYYTGSFDTVELNASFYRLPESDTFAAWADRVPRGFTFAVKASRYLTHMKRLREPVEPLTRLWTSSREIGPASLPNAVPASSALAGGSRAPGELPGRRATRQTPGRRVSRRIVAIHPVSHRAARARTRCPLPA